MSCPKFLSLDTVNVHNLKGVSVDLPKNQLIVFTGVSGSGKSSLAFDTIFVEGQRRYIESLPHQARRQMGELQKPEAKSIEGITPTISIEQKTGGNNPRSTVGTMTEIYDFLRLLFAKVATFHCPLSQEEVMPQSKESLTKKILSLPKGQTLTLLSPLYKEKKGEFKEELIDLQKKGFYRARIDGLIIHLGDEIKLDKQKAHTVELVIDRVEHTKENETRVKESILTALKEGKGECLLLLDNGSLVSYSEHAYSPKSGLSYFALEPSDFSFNSPSGMCDTCAGLGEIKEFDLSKIIDEEKSIQEQCCLIAKDVETVRYGNIYSNLASLFNFSLDTPWKKLSEKAKHVFLYGTEKKWTRMRFVHPITGKTWIDHVRWEGVLKEAHQRYEEAKSDLYKRKLEALMSFQICPSCHGGRLKPYPMAAKLMGKTIFELSSLSIKDLSSFFQTLTLSKDHQLIAGELLIEIKERLHFLEEVGLNYLTLHRKAPSLSGGEAQRVRLASQIGSGLVGITYVLDEPSIGLHPIDNQKLIKTLKRLRDKGNSVIVVEHDEETLLEADLVLDLGPKAGKEGGEIVFFGDVKALLNDPNSLTAKFLRGDLKIERPGKRRKKGKEQLFIKGASHNNLKEIDVSIPLGLFVVVTGVSGSGKSSLIIDTLHPFLANKLHKSSHPVGKHKAIKGIEHIDKVISIDQSPIGKTPRSNPATYTKVFDEIRALFSSLPEALSKGFDKGRFSFNVKEGACSSCHGMGVVKIDMDFLEDVWRECSLCKGKRFDEETLSCKFKGKSIFDVLEMEVREALAFFSSIPSIKKTLETLKEVGLDYIKLGQFSTTLSGGEAQRIKLAKELARPQTGKTLYILDEPTTGLHPHDIKALLSVLHKLVDQGNSVIVIEHNVDVMKTADWIVDLGPNGGDEGGELIASCTPEKLVKQEGATAASLRWHLDQSRKTASLEQKKAAPEDQMQTHITIEGASQNNLNNISLSIPREKITFLTGPSGSGKSSLAFETIYAEGQRRYTESMSPYARQFIKQMNRPKVEKVEGLSPAIAVEQKAHAGNPRSTIGTITEIYDYLRILYARLGIAFCPETKEKIESITKESVLDHLFAQKEGAEIWVLAPLKPKTEEEFDALVKKVRNLGFLRVRLNETAHLLEEVISFDPKRKNSLELVIDRLFIEEKARSRLFEALAQAELFGKGEIALLVNGEKMYVHLSFSVKSTGKSYPTITPQSFSFNSAEGMCSHCYGIGTTYGTDLLEMFPHLTVSGLFRLLLGAGRNSTAMQEIEKSFLKQNINLYSKIASLDPSQKEFLLKGEGANSSTLFTFRGIEPVFEKLAKSGPKEIKEMIAPLLHEKECPACHGERINPLSRNVLLEGVSLPALCKMPITEAYLFLQKIDCLGHPEIKEILEQLEKRARFLLEIGLGYLSFERKAPTLSGGEAQRIRLAAQIGAKLTGVLYVLDEPSIGLHPRDSDKVMRALTKLKELGNTLVIVEHDLSMIEQGDFIVDFGPGSGRLGGNILSSGSLQTLLSDPLSLTGAYLRKEKSVPLPEKKRMKEERLTLKNGSMHNLKNVTCSFRIGALNVLTGVSGSGKSTIMHEILAPAVGLGLKKEDMVHFKGAVVEGIGAFERLSIIDQQPIGHTSRSDVATYVDLLTHLRSFFAKLPDAAIRGLLPKHFSYNHTSGMCTRCQGLGYRRIDMVFLPEVHLLCDMCEGERLNSVSLEVKYRGKNLGEYLKTTVDQALSIFENHPKIVRILRTLSRVGLGYLTLGQEMHTLSGGEAQRIKLSKELSKRSYGKTLYLLDEPTLGLHNQDIGTLLGPLHALVDKGNTMIVIEHNSDFIKTCDYVVDLGPESGNEGGKVLYEGPLESFKSCKNSYTARYL